MYSKMRLRCSYQINEFIEDELPAKKDRRRNNLNLDCRVTITVSVLGNIIIIKVSFSLSWNK
jgi:hypothetical protein